MTTENFEEVEYKILVPQHGTSVKYHLENPIQARLTMCGLDATNGGYSKWNPTGESVYLPLDDETFCKRCIKSAKSAKELIKELEIK